MSSNLRSLWTPAPELSKLNDDVHQPREGRLADPEGGPGGTSRAGCGGCAPARHDESDTACGTQAHVALGLVGVTTPPSNLSAATHAGPDAQVSATTLSTNSHMSHITDNTTFTYDQQGIAPRRGKRRLSPETRKQIADQRRAGVMVKQLAADYDLNRRTIMEVLRTEGIPARKPTLGPEHRDEIARLYATGLSVAQVALRFGVSDDLMFHTFRRLGIPTRPRRGAGPR